MSLTINNPIMMTLQENPGIGILTSIGIILMNLIGTMTPLITFAASIGGIVLIVLTIFAKVKEIQKTNLDIKEKQRHIYHFPYEIYQLPKHFPFFIKRRHSALFKEKQMDKKDHEKK